LSLAQPDPYKEKILRRILFCSLGLSLGVSCKTIHKNTSQQKVLERTPATGIVGVLDKVPVLVENSKPTVVSINRLAGSPSGNAELRLEQLDMTLVPGDSYTSCKPKLIKATFSELVEKDIQNPDELTTRATYRMQELSMTIEGDADKGWILYVEGGHDIGDLYLTFETNEKLTCRVSATGHGYYAVRGTGNWGEGSGDLERDRLVRAWGADRGHRLWHYLWHGMRSQWTYLEQKDQDALKAAYGKSVEPPQRDPKGTPDGEDFLYMHHNMLRTLKQHLQSQGKEMVPAWKVLPRYGDTAHPSTGDASMQQEFDTWEKDLQDLEKVKGMTLGEYGEAIESTIHNNMHMRFMNPNDLEIPGDPLDPEWEKKYSKLFDDPAYDYLGGTYSSHVNPVFFKVHGWVDDRIQTWLEAHGYKAIGSKSECNAQPDCYVWLSDKAYAFNENTAEKDQTAKTDDASKAEAEKLAKDREPWEGVAPAADRSQMGLHIHAGLKGTVPNLSARARARIYSTRRMGGF
jgi:hypothetical protein